MYDDIIRPYTDRLTATGRKETTVSVIASRVTSCLRTLEQAGRPTDPLKLTEADFLWLKEELITTRARESTVRTMLANLDALVRVHGGRSILHTADILWNRTLPDRAFITIEDAARMYEAADPPIRLVIVLGALMGLRREEMFNVRLADVGTDGIVIHGKGHGRAGLVTRQPMPAEVRRELEQYLPWRTAHAPAGSDRLLVLTTASRGLPVKESVMLDEMSKRVRELGVSLGIRVTAHSLRRLYATTVYEITGHDAAVTQALMRHATSVTTIDCYIKPNARAKADAVKKIGSVIKF